jgi:5-(carboxyamino)imidazole ribonucleotide synthase
LGDVTLMTPVAMANLLGEVWDNGPPDFAAALAVPGVNLHLYGKNEPRHGRKMGHLTAMAETVELAEQRVLEARRRMRRE